METRPRRDLSADFSIWCPAPTTQWYASAPPTFWTLYGCQYRSSFSQHDVARNRLIDNAALYKTNLCVVEGIRTLTLSDSLFLLPFRTFQARSAYNWVARTLKSSSLQHVVPNASQYTNTFKIIQCVEATTKRFEYNIG